MAPLWPGAAIASMPPPTLVPPPTGTTATRALEAHSSVRSTSASSRAWTTKSGEARVAIPAVLADVAPDAVYDRARYGLGRAYVDVVRGFRGEIAHPPK